ncbi:MAG: biotin carboxylase N-terminal domain-containing protein [Roseovarius sp.]|nr:biotin carboxylase N-terminal domain-containing protein [Roseovarius sp.]
MNFSTVLIANRGEIALRLVRACQGLGLRAVAVYSDADRDAPHVIAADTAVHIGPPEAAQSYLDGERIIAAAKQAGAQAIHPGYGFLAENADFAQACADAGLAFVGPSPENIALMGSKIAAKAVAVAANVPVVPGYYGDDQSDDRLLAEAHIIGVPLLIKASAGGGGRGMRQVHDLSDFVAELTAARSEAEAAFGDSQVLLERYVGTARHIEVQILADQQGNVRHLFERDCSLQRNHQKVIEEAPAPQLSADVRASILDSAVRLTQGIGYDSAGTVEFLLDADTGDYFFLEMNTRLQVEHPVTEAVTGIDIAAWQLRIAGGETLPFTQDEITCTGWSLEARIAAEDPANNYRPEIGEITGYTAPDMPGLRLDSGVRAGSTVSHYYDSMLAKLISSARDRASAIRLLDQGLSRFHITGPGTNIAFSRDLLALPDFAAGTHSTASLGAAFPDGWCAPVPGAHQQAEAILACFLAQNDEGASDPWTTLGAWRVTEPSGRRGGAIYRINDEDARIEGREGRYVVTLHDGAAFDIENAILRDGILSYEADGMRHSARVEIDDENVSLDGQTGRASFVVLNSDGIIQAAGEAALGGGDQVNAPMPGLVSDVLIQTGDIVTAGQPVVVIEAMKLLQTLTAPCAGTISQINFSAGENVDMGAVLITINPEE